MASTPFVSHPFAVVDVETTGASAFYDRVTEVAVVRLEGGEVRDTFHSLVDPGVPIPSFITRMTGISDHMVRGKPSLEALLPTLAPLLDGAVFVAHNVSFDHAFLQHAWTRVGAKRTSPLATMPQLCTVRLGRRLVPALRSHRLDELLRHFAIANQARHRALGDASATAELLVRLLALAESQGLQSLQDLLHLQQSPVGKRLRQTVDDSVVASLPAGPGVYLLRDGDGHVLYVGKSQSVRQRVRDHLRGDAPGQPRLRRALRRVKDVEAFETGSELEALFLESRLIKRYLPEANSLGRTRHDYPFLRLTADPFPRLEPTREPPNGRDLYFGPLRRAGAVASTAEYLSQSLGLRSCQEPIGSGHGPCLLLDLGKCSGPCVGDVDAERYGALAERAVALLEGRDTSLLRQLERQRDALAAELRFEEAAQTRDRLRELEYVLGAQRSLQSVGARNLVVVAPALAADCREVLFIRGGRLAHQMTERGRPRSATYQRALRNAYSGPGPQRPVSHDEVDEMHLLDSWLRRKDSVLRQIAVDPADPLSALAPLLAAVREPFPLHKPAPRRATTSPVLPQPGAWPRPEPGSLPVSSSLSP
jgi:DNA polymerase III subunit epsilon